MQLSSFGMQRLMFLANLPCTGHDSNAIKPSRASSEASIIPSLQASLTSYNASERPPMLHMRQIQSSTVG